MKKALYLFFLLFSSLSISQTLSHTIYEYDKLITQNPNDMSNYYSRGLLKASFNDFKGSINDFNIVIANNPKNINALYSRALSKAGINNNSGAITDLSQIVKYDPNNADAFYKRSFLNAVEGNKSQACSDARKASSLGLIDAESLVVMLCN